MKVIPILKAAFALSVVLYGAVSVLVAGPPDWDRPVLSGDSPLFPLLAALTALSLLLWAGGGLVGRRREPWGPFAGGSRPWPLQRFVAAAALVEGGAVLGLALALVLKDSRYGLAHAFVSALLLLLLPGEGKEG